MTVTLSANSINFMNGGENLRFLNTFIKFATVVMQLHMWSELLVPLLNMIK